MTTLTQAAVTTRKIIRYGIFFIIFLIVGRIILNLGLGLYRKVHPPAPPPPTVTFGKLPVLPFPQKDKVNYSLTLETVEGGLPTLPSTVKVYYMPKRSANLLSLDEARQKASGLGFPAGELATSPTVYQFKSTDNNSILILNIITGTFSISYNLQSDPSSLKGRAPAAELAASNMKSFLSSVNLLPPDLTGPVSHDYLKVNSGKLVTALSLSDANLTKVHFFRANYEDYPSLTSDPAQANVWFLVDDNSAGLNRGIVAAEFHYFPVDSTQFATYPIKTAQTAWDELTGGNGYLANIGANPSGGQIKIRKIYLAYYDAGVTMDYYQPIVVFEGDNGFLAYVPAVTATYYGK